MQQARAAKHDTFSTRIYRPDGEVMTLGDAQAATGQQNETSGQAVTPASLIELVETRLLEEQLAGGLAAELQGSIDAGHSPVLQVGKPEEDAEEEPAIAGYIRQYAAEIENAEATQDDFGRLFDTARNLADKYRKVRTELKSRERKIAILQQLKETHVKTTEKAKLAIQRLRENNEKLSTQLLAMEERQTDLEFENESLREEIKHLRELRTARSAIDQRNLERERGRETDVRQELMRLLDGLVPAPAPTPPAVETDAREQRLDLLETRMKLKLAQLDECLKLISRDGGRQSAA